MNILLTFFFSRFDIHSTESCFSIIICCVFYRMKSVNSFTFTFWDCMGIHCKKIFNRSTMNQMGRRNYWLIYLIICRVSVLTTYNWLVAYNFIVWNMSNVTVNTFYQQQLWMFHHLNGLGSHLRDLIEQDQHVSPLFLLNPVKVHRTHLLT